MSLKDLQDAISQGEQVNCPVTNHFTDGCYARELFIPAGTCLVGATHKTNHFMMIVKGRCAISDSGKKAVMHEGPLLVETKAGTKRAISAISDTILITFHVTEKKDVSDIGDEILQKENIAYLPHWKAKALEDRS